LEIGGVIRKYGVPQKSTKDVIPQERISLPTPKYEGRISLEKSLFNRRSVREFNNRPLSLAELSQLLWAAQGMNHRGGFRTAPSAGALYPLDLYVLAGNVSGLHSGLYKYSSRKHGLVKISSEDKILRLRLAAFDQPPVSEAGIVLVFCAVYKRTTWKYGQRGIRYVHLEAGHAAQNVYLQAMSLQLGTVVLGAFDDTKVKDVLGLKEEEPLYLMPVGKR
jgi:SagB-type dehydrogenase family enzyme